MFIKQKNSEKRYHIGLEQARRYRVVMEDSPGDQLELLHELEKIYKHFFSSKKKPQRKK